MFKKPIFMNNYLSRYRDLKYRSPIPLKIKTNFKRVNLRPALFFKNSQFVIISNPFDCPQYP
jgi:hypothetical protein